VKKVNNSNHFVMIARKPF